MGLLLGPFIGAILYHVGGYMLPFFSIAGFYFLMYPLIAYTLAKISAEEKKLSPRKLKDSNREEDHPQITTKHLFKEPRFVFGLISQIVVYSAITFLQPTLALHLEKFGYHATFIGFSFAVPTMIYAATAPLVYLLTSKFRKTAVIIFGYAIVATGLFFVGPSKILGIQNSAAFIILGLAILGFGGSMIIIPIMPEMIESIEERYTIHDEVFLHNQISGMFIAFQGIGETLGPVLGSVLQHKFGFRSSQDFMACGVSAFMILYFLFCGGFSIFLSKSNKDNIEQLQLFQSN